MYKHLILFLCIILLLVSCSDDSTGTKDEDVFGNYKATELTANGIDYIKGGMIIEIELKTDYSFVGYFFIPDTLGLLDEEDDKGINFDGTFEVSGKSLKFHTIDDVYIRDAEWTFDENKIYTEDFVHTVLTKQ